MAKIKLVDFSEREQAIVRYGIPIICFLLCLVIALAYKGCL